MQRDTEDRDEGVADYDCCQSWGVSGGILCSESLGTDQVANAVWFVSLLLRARERGRTSNEEDSSDCSLLGIADDVCGEEGKSDSVGDNEWERPILSATTTDEDV